MLTDVRDLGIAPEAMLSMSRISVVGRKAGADEKRFTLPGGVAQMLMGGRGCRRAASKAKPEEQASS